MQFNSRVLPYKSSRSISFDWSTFSGGLNTLRRANEIDKSELAQADNLVLIGKGVPTKRWGIANYYSGGSTGSVRGIKGFYKSNTTNELISITDEGFLRKRNGTSFATINGASWASGSNAFMTQLNDTIYIVNGTQTLTKYSSPTLVGFPTVAVPSITGASNISNASGLSVKGYRVSAVSSVGETLASSTFELKTQPKTLGGTAGGVVRLVWGAVSTASGILQGYNIYGRDSGNETFLAGVDAASTVYFDDGSSIPRLFTYPPTADSTGGPVAKYIVRFQDRLVFAGLSSDPSKVLISGKVPNHEKFDISFGGNFIKIEPDAGDDVTGLIAFADRILVFKTHSIWQISLSTEQIGNFFVTNPVLRLITAARGCIAPRSIVFVENDVFYLSQQGVHSLGYQTGFTIDQLRSNEASAKIRPFFDSLTTSQKQNAAAAYLDFKYFISFPGSTKTMVFDVQRGAWMGPWSFDANVFEVYTDTSSVDRLLIGRSADTNIDEVSSIFLNDKNTAITTAMSTKKEDFGDWSLFKTIKSVFTDMRNVSGTVAVNLVLEQKSGAAVTAKSFNIVPATGVTGWGSDQWAIALWGSSSNKIASGIDVTEIIRWANINQAARTLQVTIKTNNANDNYELLGIRGEAKLIGSGFRPSQWRV